ncbi:MAG: hypothetical protein KAX82_02980, partial [Burkholderiales bacterium]|nr:hypothetical protein [Burkholderiales bacterium]
MQQIKVARAREKLLPTPGHRIAPRRSPESPATAIAGTPARRVRRPPAGFMAAEGRKDRDYRD